MRLTRELGGAGVVKEHRQLTTISLCVNPEGSTTQMRQRQKAYNKSWKIQR